MLMERVMSRVFIPILCLSIKLNHGKQSLLFQEKPSVGDFFRLIKSDAIQMETAVTI